ncbi:MAG: hypothetical protein GTO60_03680, partial [Gammaproteobacteria bacterium]|nr:hypothetical protein [Gammaproteobacteria bacterium]
MKRREFCRTAIAAGVGAGYPFLYGCDRGIPDARQANTNIRGISLAGNEIELEAAAVREFAQSVTGPVMLSGHPDYDSVRMIWNGMHDRRPALIARCMNSEDVSQAVSFARDHDLLLAV